MNFIDFDSLINFFILNIKSTVCFYLHFQVDNHLKVFEKRNVIT